MVVITGAGSGMGRAMAVEFARHGGRVVAVDIDGARAADTVDLLGDAGALALVADVADPAAVAGVINATVEEFGGLDVLCNNAGVLDAMRSAIDTTDEQWARVLAVNLTSVFLVSRAAIPVMLEHGGGVIVNTASIAGLVAGAGGAAYTASKHGVVGLTRQLAFDHGPDGIRVNAICPGAVDTPMTRELQMPEGFVPPPRRLRMAARRMAQPEEIAKLAVYLASDDASFIHGATFTIDGGWTMQ